MNRNIGRGLIVDQKIPEVTKTVYVMRDIKVKEKKKRWGIGVQSGYQITGKPYIGVGISYNLITLR
jgi:hypothetical protein